MCLDLVRLFIMCNFQVFIFKWSSLWKNKNGIGEPTSTSLFKHVFPLCWCFCCVLLKSSTGKNNTHHKKLIYNEIQRGHVMLAHKRGWERSQHMHTDLIIVRYNNSYKMRVDFGKKSKTILFNILFFLNQFGILLKSLVCKVEYTILLHW